MPKDIKRISLNVSFEQAPKEEIALIGFLFYCDGRYLQQAPVRDNLLEFNLAETTTGPGNAPRSLDIRQLQVFIAPATHKRIQEVRSIEGLEPYKPYSPDLQTNPEGNIRIFPTPSLLSTFSPLSSR